MRTSILWQMEDNLEFLANGRQPRIFGKLKTTSIFWWMDDNLNLQQMEDDLIILVNGSQPNYFLIICLCSFGMPQPIFSLVHFWFSTDFHSDIQPGRISLSEVQWWWNWNTCFRGKQDVFSSITQNSNTH